MKTVLKISAIFISISLFLPIFVFAQSPSLPHQFFGTVKFADGVAIPNGRTVEAKINGAVVGSSITSGGNYGYSPNLLFALDNNGVNAGKTVDFYIGGIKTNETETFANGSSSQLNLTISTPTPTPISISTPTPTPASGGGSGSNNSLPSSTPGPTPTLIVTPALKIVLTEEQKKVDANKDNKIDVLDFNTLMANWGNTGSNLADFNGNGVVDVMDFNSLMINWS